MTIKNGKIGARGSTNTGSQAKKAANQKAANQDAFPGRGESNQVAA
jgi:hypothetical protein